MHCAENDVADRSPRVPAFEEGFHAKGDCVAICWDVGAVRVLAEANPELLASRVGLLRVGVAGQLYPGVELDEVPGAV